MPYKEKWRQELSVKLSLYKRYVRAKKAVFEALGNRCSRCGIADPAVLVVHHKNPSLKTPIEKARSQKSNKFSGMRNVLYWEALLKNLENLELLCANCHFREHYKDPEEIIRKWEKMIHKPRRTPKYLKVYRLIKEGKGRDEIMKELNLSLHCFYDCVRRARKHGLKIPKHWKRWSGKELEILRKHYMNSPKNLLLQLLPSRSWPAIMKKSMKLGIHRIARGNLQYLTKTS